MVPISRRSTALTLAAFVFIVTSNDIQARFYFPGEAPVDYRGSQLSGDGKILPASNITLYVNRLQSLESALTFDYVKFDFCEVADPNGPPGGNIGQFLLGDRIRRSSLQIPFLENVTCRTVCSKKYLRADESSVQKLEFLQRSILLNYQQEWIIDNLPVRWCYDVAGDDEYCSIAFPIGCYVSPNGQRRDACVLSTEFFRPDTYYLFNHLDIELNYTDNYADHSGERVYRILSAKLKPRSIQQCTEEKLLNRPKQVDYGLPINYTYSVRFVRDSDNSWSSRWDYILDEAVSHAQIHIFSLANAVFIVLFLGGVLAISMRNMICREETSELTLPGLVGLNAEDAVRVFQPPVCCMLLSALLGNGVQMLLVVFCTLAAASLGLLSPANRGALAICPLVLYVCFALAGGYTSAKLYKMFHGQRHVLNALLSACLCPGLFTGILLLTNALQYSYGSSAALPWTILGFLLAIWLCACVPLTLAGSYFGYRWTSVSPKRPACYSDMQMRRRGLRGYVKRILGVVLAGVLTFGCLFIQLFFVMNSVWSLQLYDYFGFLFLSLVLAVVVGGECSALLSYYRLQASDTTWCWWAFLYTGSSAGYCFLYCMHYLVNKLQWVGVVDACLYFLFTCAMLVPVFLLMGAVGFFSSFWLIVKIYSHAFYHLAQESQPPDENQEEIM